MLKRRFRYRDLNWDTYWNKIEMDPTIYTLHLTVWPSTTHHRREIHGRAPCTSQILWPLLRHYPICIISSVTWMLKQSEQWLWINSNIRVSNSFYVYRPPENNSTVAGFLACSHTIGISKFIDAENSPLRPLNREWEKNVPEEAHRENKPPAFWFSHQSKLLQSGSESKPV